MQGLIGAQEHEEAVRSDECRSIKASRVLKCRGFQVDGGRRREMFGRACHDHVIKLAYGQKPSKAKSSGSQGLLPSPPHAQAPTVVAKFILLLILLTLPMSYSMLSLKYEPSIAVSQSSDREHSPSLSASRC